MKVTSSVLSVLSIAVLASCTSVGVGNKSPVSSAEDEFKAAITKEVNELRISAGANALQYNDTLAQAAKKHSRYLLAHAEISHYQTKKESQFFTGQVASVRSKKERYDYSALSEVIRGSFSETPSEMMRSFIAAPFHRIGLLRDDLVDVGVGVEQVSARHYSMLTIDMGSREIFYFGQRQTSPVVWPYSDQDGVPTSFNSDDEIPDPYPGKNLIGFPVTVQVSTQDLLTVKSFSLVKIATGKEVPGIVSWRETSGFMKSIPYSAVFLPHEPLEPKTAYQVTFEGAASTTPVKVTWKFTTGN